ncbi:bifunctional tRNA (5-methylaminomethyl-2-thiouridine)(34)-methyltransferase MnmD/FAD-dependent 5-carboxymethylaminomethyl-2-thiouridine(34) oxidoreductase MnmC [Microbulbifer litoralis]|uniref:bifunctional tRNA (5-methylaminomethyl-2-thiouridine)(34)-methyltransferase MnmD/FAD-dependent 5-carboxymethylaminomethyl-2-thiouridine(34) oxidoreductase MnmC n=1 Tax=Microbulbifer litoralis TaxID=2933965 RepID=UPI00202867DF
MSDEKFHAEIQWRDDGQPLSPAFDDIYFSSESGLDESRYVFLQQNELPQRFAALAAGDTFTIGETGFGTGLNFLAAWDLWRQSAPTGAHLHFVSVEKFPLRRHDLERALALWPQLQPLARQLLQQYPPFTARGVHRLHFGPVQLTLAIGEASEAFAGLRLGDDHRDRNVAAWFLDGFAPAKNPDMWTPALFDNIAALSRPGASFATFTCAGIVKRGLKKAGFALEKVPGFGRKREMLRGRLQETLATAPAATPWHLPPESGADADRRSIAVIGAGIAGATCARALAERGHKVAVYEQGPHPAGGASGNDRGILYAKLSPRPGPNGDFNLHALMFAQRYYRQRSPQAVHFDGLLQLAQSEKEQALQGQIGGLLQRHGAGALARTVDAIEAGEIAGLPLDFGGLYFPQSGWLEPRRVCAALLAHENIELRCDTRIESLERGGEGWQLRSVRGEDFRADAVVICTANAIRQLPQTSALPLRPIRGQVSGATATAYSGQLKTALCGDGYLTPGAGGRHSFGASFKLKETDTELREEEHRDNLDTLAAMVPAVAAGFAGQHLGGRAALRAATPDYLPMAGPVPDWDALDTTYAGLRRNRKLLIPQRAACRPNLFVLGGLGSRGFTYAPLAAEVLAAWIGGEVLPVPAELAKALHPARFAIRDLGKNR